MPTEAPVCIICGKAQDPRFKPFCSRRCANVDLGRWLKGSYSIPGPVDEDEGGKPPPAGDET